MIDKFIPRPTICLAVMFRNEENFIADLIDSVAPYISFAVFLDSSSTDNSLQVLRDQMDKWGIPFSYANFDEPFRADTKRTRLMELAKGTADYILQIDADNTLEILPERHKTINNSLPVSNIAGPFMDLDKDAYLLNKKIGDLVYPIVCLLRGNLDWEFVGIIHEFPQRKGGVAFTQGDPLPGIIIHEPVKGATERRVKTVKDFMNDALLIEKEMLDKGGEMAPMLFARYAFYLGNSYKDAGMNERAIDAYKLRISLGIWDQEIFYSLYQIALIKQDVGSALQAWNYRPHRLEAAMLVMQQLAAADLPMAALAIGIAANAAYKSRNGVKDVLFVEISVYDDVFPELLRELEAKCKPV